MELEILRQHMDARFDRLEDKVDNHLERLSKAEAAIEWLKGHVKFTTAVGLAVVGTVMTWWFTRVSQ